MSFAVWDFIFQPFLFQIRSSGGFYLCRTNLHRSLTPLQQALFCAPLVSFPYPVPKTAQRAAQGRVLVFSPERAYPSPFRGRGEVSPVWFAGFFTQRSPVLFRRKRRILRIRGLLLAVALATAAHTASTGPVTRFAGVVLLPSHLTGHKSPHRGEFGFCLLAGASQEDHPPFRQSRIRTQAEEKNTSAPLF